MFGTILSFQIIFLLSIASVCLSIIFVSAIQLYFHYRLFSKMFGLELLNACTTGELSKVEEVFSKCPDMDVNSQAPLSGFTALHISCINGYHKIVKYLLGRPGIDPNISDVHGMTPFTSACFLGKVDILFIMMKCGKVDVNFQECDANFVKFGATPIIKARNEGCVDVVKIMIASGRPLVLAGEYNPVGKPDLVEEANSWIDDFKRDPLKTTQMARKAFVIDWEMTHELFALTVLLCDDYLKLKTEVHDNPPAARFFSTMLRLPMELQMIMCSKVYGLTSETIASIGATDGLKRVVREFYAGEIL